MPGLPKPVTWTHGFFAAGDNLFHKKPPPGKRSAIAILQNARLFNMTPAFHSAGAGTMTFFGIWLKCCSVLPPPSVKPLDGAAVANALKYANASCALVVPSILEDISKDSNLSDALRHVEYMIWSGGNLPPEAGEKLKNETQLVSYLGATETAVFHHVLHEDPDDWKYVEIDDSCNVEFREQADGLYELIQVRDQEHEKYQPIWHVFPDLQEYHTRDVFSKHPTNPKLWLYAGRLDDIIVFVNGEKINPISIEDFVSSHNSVRSAIVGGQGRFQACLLVEPIHALSSTAEKAKVLEEIWPLVEKMNEESPAHGRISKAHIMFTGPEKWMMRAGKGTVQRKLTLATFSDEIEKLYADAESLTKEEGSALMKGSADGDLESVILQLVQETIRLELLLGPDDDFFSRGGLDSLQVLQLTRHIRLHRRSLRDGHETISPSLVYNNPTASSLARAIERSMTADRQRLAAISKARANEMQSTLEQLSKPREDEPSEGRETIVLTGATGAIGSYLLDTLLETPKVKKIYCLDRATSLERQKEISSSKGLSTSFHNKVEFYVTNFEEPSFGLSPAIYDTLCEKVTRIIHAAWPVDFNRSLQSFQPQLQTLRALIEFSSHAGRPKSLLFLSSISSVGNWHSISDAKARSNAIPEVPLSDFDLPLSNGYAESKFLAEQLLVRSSCLANVSICRVGQIAGPTTVGKKTSIWKRDEWIPSLVRSSHHLGCLPATLGRESSSGKGEDKEEHAKDFIDWIPIDRLAPILVDLALLPNDQVRLVYHAVNPQTTSWQHNLLPAIQKVLSHSHSSTPPSSQTNHKPQPTQNSISTATSKPIEIVPYKDWLSRLRSSANKTFENKDWELNPAIKLLDFFEGMANPAWKGLPRLSTTQTAKFSPSMRSLEPVSGEMMARWCRQW